MSDVDAIKRTRGQHGAAKPRPPGTLKAAVLQIVDAIGGCPKAGELTETTKGTWQRMTDPDGDNANVYPGVNKIRALEAHHVAQGGEPIVTRFMAAEVGYALIKIEPHTPKALQLLAGLAGGEMGDLMRAICDAFADDGQLSPSEAGRIVKEGHEVLGAVAAAIAVAMRVRDGGEA
ncbi:hypothetical protein sos41_11550 [Alphaproteobacteria bacterium SO-S41]|nr:hypothetical protein sos41_11550 [Alphaproteobacteria bacterium SO-S41]